MIHQLDRVCGPVWPHLGQRRSRSIPHDSKVPRKAFVAGLALVLAGPCRRSCRPWRRCPPHVSLSCRPENSPDALASSSTRATEHGRARCAQPGRHPLSFGAAARAEHSPAGGRLARQHVPVHPGEPSLHGIRRVRPMDQTRGTDGPGRCRGGQRGPVSTVHSGPDRSITATGALPAQDGRNSTGPPDLLPVRCSHSRPRLSVARYAPEERLPAGADCPVRVESVDRHEVRPQSAGTPQWTNYWLRSA